METGENAHAACFPKQITLTHILVTYLQQQQVPGSEKNGAGENMNADCMRIISKDGCMGALDYHTWQPANSQEITFHNKDKVVAELNQHWLEKFTKRSDDTYELCLICHQHHFGKTVKTGARLTSPNPSVTF